MPGSRAWEEEPSDDPLLYQVADDIFHRLGEADYTGELSVARDWFEERRGHVRQDEELWETWTQAFLEWFAFEWQGPGPGGEQPALRALAGETDERRAAALRAWLRSQRALVAIGSHRPGRVKVRDLCGGAVFEVAEQRSLHGVEEGDVAEVRLIGFEGKVRFGRTFLYHPSGTGPAIEEQVAQMRAQGRTLADIVDHCAALLLRNDRYRHVDPLRLFRAAIEDLTADGYGG